VTSLNGLNASSQTFSTGTSGMSPNWSSATSIHTFNIPLASVSSVTAGLLSNSDWTNFNNKATTAGTWSTTGNTATNSGINFLGTTDLKSLRFRTNNIHAMVVDSLGNVSIGATPTYTSNPDREKFLVYAGSSANPTTS
jgi:hypothetical protein